MEVDYDLILATYYSLFRNIVPSFNLEKVKKMCKYVIANENVYENEIVIAMADIILKHPSMKIY